jgi:hypothetical protein
MPTVGWIQETNIERYWEHPYPPERYEPPAIPCGYCGRIFSSSDELGRHLGLDHPLSIPILHVRAQPAASELSIRTPVQPNDIALLNCTACVISKNGGESKPITPKRLVTFLATERSSRCTLTLVNERSLDGSQAAAQFIVRFSIPSQDALNAIDKEFIDRFAQTEHPRIADVEGFRAACPSERPAQEYASALGDYVIGLAVKERHPEGGALLEFEHYKEKFTGALGVLKQFHRPVARAVTSVIDFNLNNFAASPAPTKLHNLGAAFSFFQAIAQGQGPAGFSRTSSRHTSICPVDIVTHRILDAAQRLSSTRKPHALLAAELEELSRWQPLSEYDTTKIQVMSAAAHLRLGNPTAAEHHLRALRFNFLFGGWAQARLDLHSTNGRTDAT